VVSRAYQKQGTSVVVTLACRSRRIGGHPVYQGFCSNQCGSLC
jgi:hypothetical protein